LGPLRGIAGRQVGGIPNSANSPFLPTCESTKPVLPQKDASALPVEKQPYNAELVKLPVGFILSLQKFCES
jgi:hypothetical protein